MRRAPIPHNKCGNARVCGRRKGWLQLARALVGLAAAGLFFTLGAWPSAAQDPSLKVGQPGSGPSSTFAKPNGNIMGPQPPIDRAAPLYLQADQLLYDTKNNRVIAQGNVEVYYNNYILTADQLVYDQNTNKLIAEGSAQLKDPNNNITRADRFEALDDFRDAFIQSVSAVMRDDTRIAADRASRREGNLTEYERGKFTPCKSDPGVPPLWCIGAARIIHDQRNGTVSYQDAQFELFGIPVLYTPYFQHADPSVKQRTGFLIPSFASSSSLGFWTQIPYQIALAPNYDFLFNPKYFAKYGTMWQGEWRHRLADGQYSVKFAAIDESASDVANTVNNPGWRGSVQTNGQFSLASWWRLGWDVTVESDDSFRRFFQLDPFLQTDRVNTVYLQGMNDRNYFAAKLYEFGGLLLTDTPYSNSWVLPVIDYHYIVGTPIVGGELSFTGHTRTLLRSDSTDSNHAVAEANWRRKMVDPIGQVWTPFANARGDLYNFTDAVDPVTLKPIPDDTVFRGVAAAGLLYSYPFVANTATASHVIAPTAQIITRQNKLDQKQLPNEDAKSLIFDDTLLFDIDKFSGYDRFETGTRVNVGMQYTFQANNGVYGRAVFGQSIQVAGPNPFVDPGLDPTGVVNFSPVSGLQTNHSDYVAGLYLSPFAGFNIITQSRFDESDWSLRRNDTLVDANYGPINAKVAFSYTRFDPLTSQITNASEIVPALSLRLTNHWTASTSLRYDIEGRERLQDNISLKYNDECFILTASYTETFVNNPSLGLVPDRTFMLKFELKYLGEFAYNTDALNRTFGDANLGPKL